MDKIDLNFTGLKQALATVNDYSLLMKDFPLNDLLSATELEKIKCAVTSIFSHLRKIRSTKYPIQRAIKLVEAISKDLSSQILKVLGTRRLMHIAFDEFEKVMSQCTVVFVTWEDEYEKWQGLLRDIVKRNRERQLNMVWRISPAHKKLQQRMEQMRTFRRQHEQLRTVIVRVLRPTVVKTTTLADGDTAELKPEMDAADISAIEEVNLAYENVKEVDGLDISKEGSEMWEAALKRYDERIDRVETRITARLRDQLGTAKNANEMFRIFSRFNALFVRPHIRGAIREYQTQLIQRVKDDIESLHEKFKIQYPESKSCRMSRCRDLPPVSGSIIWAKQIDRQLTAYMRRVEDVLGKGWESHVEGQKLKADGDSFRLKLNTQEIFDDWARKVQQRNLGVSGRIFAIDTHRSKTGKGNEYRLKVNFLPEIILLSKEMEEKSSILLLVAGMRKDVQILLSEGMSLVWESYKLDPYVQRLAEYAFNFQEKVDDLLVLEEQLDADVRSLDACQYSHSTFSEILNKVQKAVDDLSLHQYSNLHMWVQRLDEEVEKKLAARLQAGVQAWTQALQGKNEDDLDILTDTDAPEKPAHKPGGDPKIQQVFHEVRITNQIMYLHPSVEEARYQIMQQLFSWQAIVTSQSRIQSTRYQLAYAAINNVVELVSAYVDDWLQYQALWDLQPDHLYGQLGDDVAKWMKLLQDIKQCRTTFDTTETRESFGPIVVDYTKVQSKVSLKYDSWHKDVLVKFGQLLGQEMTQFHAQVSKSRSELEQQSIEASSTSDAVTLITYVQSLKKKMKSWEKEVDMYKEGQRILERQRFQFPNQWLHVDNIEGEWGAFNEIIRRKDSSIQTQVASLQLKIVAEDKAVETRTGDYLADWEKSKPVEGHIRPDEALQKLQIYEGKYSRLKDDRDNVAKAKEALELQEPGALNTSEDKMTVAYEELQDLKGVWSELAKIWEQIDDMKEKPWLSIQPRKLRNQLDSLITQLKELPVRLRQYASYEYVKRLLQSYTKVNMTIVELKSDALKERHWKQLMRQLRVNWVLK
ncbi:Dynein heavy chain, cytoplasmic [Armadillidium nasatum]|uniref:Dynein heavy chain, cytoplasmic n=1 Tax=Armadillidium nasatum TaxID=96803 RepID=A0A5N5TA15_9CRUS|nr:Dynein heavy chain, cytoplasmic [Armadillidium nasatum]